MDNINHTAKATNGSKYNTITGTATDAFLIGQATIHEDAITAGDGNNDDTVNNNTNNKTREEDDELDEGRRKWEEQIAQRAGVRPTTATATTATTTVNQHTPTPQSSNSNTNNTTTTTATTNNLKTTIQKTLTTIHQSTQTLQTTLHHRTTETKLSQLDYTKRNTSLTTIGTAFEFYQTLRGELAKWMGALRYIDGMVRDVELAYCEWRGDVGFNWVGAKGDGGKQGRGGKNGTSGRMIA